MDAIGIEQIARSVRDSTARDLVQGRLDQFLQGYSLGSIAMLERAAFGVVPEWIMMGIRNEVEFLCKRAHERAD